MPGATGSAKGFQVLATWIGGIFTGSDGRGRWVCGGARALGVATCGLWQGPGVARRASRLLRGTISRYDVGGGNMRGARCIVPLSYSVSPFHVAVPHVPGQSMRPISPRHTVRSSSPIAFTVCHTICVQGHPQSPSRRFRHKAGRHVSPSEGPTQGRSSRGEGKKREGDQARSIASSGGPMSLGKASADYRTTCPNSSPHPGLPPLEKGSNGQEDSTRDGHSRIHGPHPERSPAARRPL